MTTSSPSARKRSLSHSSINEPHSCRRGPLTVPEANRSPVRTFAPLLLRCASICAGDQCIDLYGGRDTSSPLTRISRRRSSPEACLSRRYGRNGDCADGGQTHALPSAASGTIHGEIDVAKDLPRNGPSGRYSHAWMSRADQSLTRQTPNTWSANASVDTGSPWVVPTPTTNPTSASMSSRWLGP